MHSLTSKAIEFQFSVLKNATLPFLLSEFDSYLGNFKENGKQWLPEKNYIPTRRITKSPNRSRINSDITILYGSFNLKTFVFEKQRTTLRVTVFEKSLTEHSEVCPNIAVIRKNYTAVFFFFTIDQHIFLFATRIRVLFRCNRCEKRIEEKQIQGNTLGCKGVTPL